MTIWDYHKGEDSGSNLRIMLGACFIDPYDELLLEDLEIMKFYQSNNNLVNKNIFFPFNLYIVISKNKKVYATIIFLTHSKTIIWFTVIPFV